MLETNKIYCGNNLDLIKQLDDNCIDLTVTSPPYDNLRTYNGFEWNFEGLANELFRVTKEGGVVVWVVGDATINGSETGTSFRQALYFKEIGFNLHDTMIYQKFGRHPDSCRYRQDFEYMFIFSKEFPKTYNKIKDRKNKKNAGSSLNGTDRNNKNELKKFKTQRKTKAYGDRGNIWEYQNGLGNTTKDKDTYTPPATFPEKLAEDHIISWSNKGDLILDPFMGSGTTAKMALKNERNFIGFELSQEYVDLANKRISGWKEQTRLI